MASIVTGSAGFVGRILTQTLLAAGHQVIGIDRRPQRALPGLTVLTADLLDADDLVMAAFEDADVVYHLAGCPGVRDAGPGIAWRRHRDNVLAGARVLALVPRGVPLVVASSSSVYGGAHHGRPSHETDPLAPIGGYARSKVTLERLCLAGHRGGHLDGDVLRGGHLDGVPLRGGGLDGDALRGGHLDGVPLRGGRLVTVVRPFTVAGEGQRPDMALALWLEAARTGRPLRVLGSLERTRDITDVRQAAQALIDLTGIPGVVNVGTGRGHSLRAMAAAVSEVTGTEVRFAIEPAPPVEPGNSLADTRRLRSLIGWVPETDLLDVVRRQAAAAIPVPSSSASSASGIATSADAASVACAARELVVVP